MALQRKSESDALTKLATARLAGAFRERIQEFTGRQATRELLVVLNQFRERLREEEVGSPREFLLELLTFLREAVADLSEAQATEQLEACLSFFRAGVKNDELEAPVQVLIKLLGFLSSCAGEMQKDNAEPIGKVLAARVLMRIQSTTEFARLLDLPFPEVYRLIVRWGVYEPRRTHRYIPDEKSEEIVELLLNTDLTRREIAAQLGVSKGSVDRRAEALRKRVLDSVGGTRFEPKVWKCPKHGLVAYAPCVACEAESEASEVDAG